MADEPDIASREGLQLGGSGTVTKLVAGTGITVDPPSGRGVVTVNASGGSGGGGDIIFDLSNMAALVTSDKYYTPRDITVADILASLTTAGTTDTIVSVKRNGVQIALLTLGTGVAVVTDTIAPVAFAAATDSLQVECLTAGTGAVGLVVVVTPVAA